MTPVSEIVPAGNSMTVAALRQYGDTRNGRRCSTIPTTQQSVLMKITSIGNRTNTV